MRNNSLRVSRRQFIGGMFSTLCVKGRRIEGAQSHSLDFPIPEDEETGFIKPFSFQNLTTWITPVNRFFIRDHFVQPDVRDWSLTIEGHVEHPVTLGYAQLLKYPSQTEVATLECAGNQLGGRLVSTGKWSGPRFQSLLQLAKVKPGSREVILEGLDEGAVSGLSEPIRFAKSIPLNKALDPATLVAHSLNGNSLPALLGYPLRAVIPGWYGANWVKWLRRIIVTTQHFRGYFNTRRYVFIKRGANGLEVTPAYEVRVKSEIARPLNGSLILHQPSTIYGAAWSGNAELVKVEVTVDGGHRWSAAELGNEVSPYAWRLWRFEWRHRGPGQYLIGARATDSRGESQPLAADPDELSGYGNNSVQWLTVNVA
jgi:DMSO/TMAO reductase YedYZ molybdopterin-dependent catalytic subunit